VLGYAVGDPGRPSTLDSAGHVPRSLVVDEAFGWTDGGPVRRRYSDPIIYEVRHAGDRVTVGPRPVTVLRGPRPGR
jgi:isoamylase